MTEGMKPKTRTTFYIEPNLLKTFKQICQREDESMSRKIEQYIARYVAVHSSGNPQLHITKYLGKTQRKTCFFCQGRFPQLYKVKYVSGLVAPTCKVCLDENKAKGPFSTVKRVLGLIKNAG